MPAGWKEAAKTKKALRRGRNIKTPEELLRLNFLYQTHGGTYGLTSALTQISENQIGLNKTAVEKRIVNSASWLKWLCENLSRQEGFIWKQRLGFQISLHDEFVHYEYSRNVFYHRSRR